MNDAPSVDTLDIKIFADGADVAGILEMSLEPYIEGFTTNPTLMRKAGVMDYKDFAVEILEAVPQRPVSFEVLADEVELIERQALEIASWGPNVNVKVPITTTSGEPCTDLIGRLSAQGVEVNVTAIFTLEQVQDVLDVLTPNVPAINSMAQGTIPSSVPFFPECTSPKAPVRRSAR